MTFHPGGATPAGNPFATGPEMDPEPLGDEAPERPYPLAAPPEVMRAAVLEYRAYGQQPLRAEPAGAALSPSALEVWRASHDDVERELADGGEFEGVRDVAVKVADNAARIACLFHVFDLGPEGAVGAEAMRAGATVAAWHLFEAKRIFGLVKQWPMTSAPSLASPSPLLIVTEMAKMLDFSDDALEAQLVQPGTYDGQLVDARQLGHDQVFVALTWRLNVPGREDPAVIEELLCAGFASGAGDPAQTALLRRRVKSICEAHGLALLFESHHALIAVVIGKPMRVVVGRGAKAGLPVAKVVGLLPPAAEDR
jgi:hypothetical protein